MGTNTLNNLTGGEFLYHTRTVLATSYPHAYRHDLRKVHGANKPPQLMSYLIETFTKAGETVFDPFAGVGGTLIGAGTCTSGWRHCVGLELDERWVAVYNQIASEMPELSHSGMMQGDCREIMRYWLSDTVTRPIVTPFDFITFDPPYNVQFKQTMTGNGGEKYIEQHSNRKKT